MYPYAYYEMLSLCIIFYTARNKGQKGSPKKCPYGIGKAPYIIATAGQSKTTVIQVVMR